MHNVIGPILAGLVFLAVYRLIVYLGLKEVVDFIVTVVGIANTIAALISWF